VDEVTWRDYGQDLEANLQDMHARVHRGAYRVKPSRRVFIAKADGRLRPLGVAALEDKIVQRAVVEVLNTVYEADFLGFSHGFRPGRGPHDALDALVVGIERKKVNWVLDADLRDFFTSLDHSWLVRFLEHRIADTRVLRLIQKWLKAGVIEDGAWSASDEGSPQGATISPLLANVYLHYVFDLWPQQWRRRHARGDVLIIRYADDVVLGFQHRSDAERFQRDLAQRLAAFRLGLNAEKTRLIRFGRFAAQQRKERGLGGPETFQFLGFPHSCTTTKDGRFLVLRKTISKRMAAKLREVRTLLMRRHHWPLEAQGRWLASVIRGHLAYYAPSPPRARIALRAGARRRGQQRVLVRSKQRRRPRDPAGRDRPHRQERHLDERLTGRDRLRRATPLRDLEGALLHLDDRGPRMDVPPRVVDVGDRTHDSQVHVRAVTHDRLADDPRERRRRQDGRADRRTGEHDDCLLRAQNAHRFLLSPCLLGHAGR
jgi:RNA-directed DNA polymerase